jgi:hypothetical protein
MIVGHLVGRDQLPLLDNHADGHVRVLVEELGGRKHEDLVGLDHEHEAVFRETNAVRHIEVERRRESLHVVGDAILVAVDDRVDVGLARADETAVPCGATAMWRAFGTIA